MVSGLNYTAGAGDVLPLTIATTPHGGWTQIQNPKAVEHGNYNYIGAINGSTGATEVIVWDHTTDTQVAIFTIADLGTPDNHDAPALMVESNSHKLMVAYCRHDGGAMYIALTANSLDSDPTISGGFAASTNIDASIGASDYTYPNLVQLNGVTNDPIYLFYRDTASSTGRLAFTKSTDGGATWSGRTVFMTGAASQFPYWRIVSDNSTRVDVFTTNIEPSTSSQLYHFYIDGTTGNYYKSDGTQITASTPWQPSAQGTLVLSNAIGPCWSWGGSWDGSAPATVIMQGISGSDNAIKVARWRTGAWQVDTVIGTVGGQLGINKYASGAAIDPTNPDQVYFASKVGASKFEMKSATSADDGATWVTSAITTSSAKDNVWAEVPAGLTAGLSVVWLYGDYTTDTSFSFGLRGA